MKIDSLDLNPLTGLPGNREIKRRIGYALDARDKMIVYLDIINFKPYNEVYGFAAGDNVILRLAGLLKKLCADICGESSFLGHIGGDDFIIITEGEYCSTLFTGLDREFSDIRNSFYMQPDVSRGFIVGWDRKGERARFDLMGICGAAFSSYREGFNTVEQVAEYATYLKEASRNIYRKGNVFLTPDDLKFLPVPVKEFILDGKVPLHVRRTVIEAMGESGLVHYGKILQQVLDGDIPVMLKKSIIFSLGRLRYLPSEEVIARYVNHGNPHLRTRAVEAVGYIGGSRRLDMIGRMVNDGNPYVSVMAVRSIGNIGHPDGLKYLKDIPADSGRWLKTEASLTRSRLGDRTVIEELKELVRDPNPVFRRKAVDALSGIPSEEAVRIICRLFESENISYVMKECVLSVSKIAEKLSESRLGTLSEMIWDMYNRAPEHLRTYLIPCIGKTGKGEVKDILNEKITSRSSLERYYALEGIRNYNDSDQMYLIRKSLRDASSQVRLKGARILGQIQDTEAMEILRKALKDDDDMVKREASRAVLKMAHASYIKSRGKGNT
ncbi:MAG: HEAT repeat domain-containing protein [Elusimicrobia bacterium]|nr:HEAT repeat domain-containing protein [Elusimicrobiota bacterium]